MKFGADMMRLIGFKKAKSDWYKMTFGSEEGKMVLADLIAFSGAHGQSNMPGDPTQTAFNEGMRRVITRIEQFVEMTPKEMRHIAEVHRDAEQRASDALYGQEEYAA